MVRRMKIESVENGTSKYNPLKHDIYRQQDNPSTSSTFFPQISSNEKSADCVRRRCAVPQDNLGVACLPSSKIKELRGIPEVSEHTSEDTRTTTSSTNAPPSFQGDRVARASRITGRRKFNVQKDNLVAFCQHANPDPIRARVRLRGGRDSGKELQGHVRPNPCNEFKPNGTVATRQMENSANDYNRPIPDRTKSPAKRESTHGDMGISNIRRPKHDPTKPRKPIIPKDHIGFSCRHLQKSIDRVYEQISPPTFNTKKASKKTDKKKITLNVLSSSLEGQITPQNKSFKANPY